MAGIKWELFGQLPEMADKALTELAPLLDVNFGEGIPVEVFRAECLEVHKTGQQIRLGWNKPVQLYRALSLLRQYWGKETIDISQKPCFETGPMLDVSRNAVLRVESVKTILRSMALMGMDIAMLYTEETFEVPQEPYFGYMRGRYTMAELKEIDDYAYMLGIEMIPCIQTLGHLQKFLRWPEPKDKYADNEAVLLADSEETYVLIRRILEAVSKPFRTKRIHIGMDEAHGVGMGAHLRKFGYEAAHSIIHRHLLRVKEMVENMGLEPMMWSDMYFRPDSPNNTYYNSEPSQAAIDSVVPGVKLIYWDYYHATQEDYQAMFDKHFKMTDQVLFAGGIWTWAGVAPDMTKTIRHNVPALEVCKRNGIPFALATVWGDDGGETDRFVSLPGLQLYAEFAYTGRYDEQAVAERFAVCCGEDWQKFMDMDGFNRIPGMTFTAKDAMINTAKCLLYQDPMVQLFAKDMEAVEMSAHYAALAERFGDYAAQGGRYGRIMTFYARLAEALEKKCYWHEHIVDAVRNNDRETAVRLAQMLPETIEKLHELRNAWRDLWNAHNKPYGFEVNDVRVGGMCARLDTARKRVLAWAAGDPNENLEELRETVLHYNWLPEGRWRCPFTAAEMMTACNP